jgi:hypothetical protein
MACILSFALTALVACSVVAAENLQSCGGSNYFPSQARPRGDRLSELLKAERLTQYNCFDGNFLCPIVNGDVCVRCGEACYSVRQYRCKTYLIL